MKFFLITFGILSLSGCITVRYENSIMINAPKDIVFMVLEDFENYPNMIPELHAETRIITENRTGFGVQFLNISTFGGFNTESIFEVVEYRLNKYIKLKNLTHYGYTELIVIDIGDGRTKYTLINYTRVPFFMRRRLFMVFDEELELIRKFIENKNE